MEQVAVGVKAIPSSVFETLRNYDSATIANIIELFHVRPSTAGHVGGSIRAIYPELSPVVGYATTATFRSAYPSDDSNAYMRFPEQLELMSALPEPRIAVIQDLDDPPMSATLGEVMCRVYRRFGCAGIITSGGARDILAVRKLNFPVFASSIIVSHGYCRLEDIHTPVWIRGVTVRPGDIVHADANGVELIPNEIVEQVAGACEEFAAIEKMVMDYLEREDATPKGYLQAEKLAGEQFEQLSARLRSQGQGR